MFGFGDMLMATPAVRLLKEGRPGVHITWYAMQKTAAQLLEGNPFVDEVRYFPFLTSGAAATAAHMIRHAFRRFDTAITFYPLNRRDYNLFAFMTGARTRIGFSYAHSTPGYLGWIHNRRLAEDQGLHCVRENVRLLSFFNLTVNDQSIPGLQLFLTDDEKARADAYFTSQPRRPVIGVHAGTSIFKGHANRRWPKEHFATLMKSMKECSFFLFGSQEEDDVNQYIIDAVHEPERVVRISGKGIRDVAALIQKTDLFVSNDSGLMHLACAVGTPVVEILGPTNPAFISPWGVKHRVMRTGIPCSPCFYYSAKPLTCSNPRQWECMTALKPDFVEKAVRELL